MLRKAGHISIILLLLLSTGGVNIYRHYCGNVLVKETVQVLPESCCHGHCKACHNEALHLKVTDNFERSSLNVDFRTCLTKPYELSQVHQILCSKEIAGLTETIKIRAVKSSVAVHLFAENPEARLQVFRL